MTTRHSLLLATATAALTGALFAADADLILHGGKIVTLDPAHPTAQAIAFKAGRIAAVGPTAAVLQAERGPKTRLIDLGGKMVLPGLIDAHVHALSAGLSEYRGALPPLDSIQSIQAFIRERARKTPKGEWIIVPRTLPPRLAEMRMPTRADLDVAPDHPVAFDGSYVWSANSMALRVSGITRDGSPSMSQRKPSWMPSTSVPERHARIVAAPITLLMPGAGPPPTRIASLSFVCMASSKGYVARRTEIRHPSKSNSEVSY